MSVLVRMSVAGMDAATYDQVPTHLVDLVKKQSGFVMHVAYPSASGFTVAEVWESCEQYENWFNERTSSRTYPVRCSKR
jgi:heme-degrading monooxygenase HmoA